MIDYKKYDKEVEMLLSEMTVEQKVGQLNQIKFNGENFDEVLPEVEAGRVGSLILAASAQAGNDEQKRGYSEKLQLLQKAAVEKTGIPLINGRDVIHGHRVVFPIPLAMAASFNPELIRYAYHIIAEEAAADGVNWSFAPMLDISRDPRWGRCIESPGEDPYLGARMAESAVSGLQERGIAACLKHFIGYGAAEGGRDYASTEIGEISLRNYYLRAFEAGVHAGAATVMTSFNALSGEPCTCNKHLIRDVLKNEMGFEGFVVSDWTAVEQIARWFGAAENRKECAEKALNAGLDMDMVSGCFLDHAKELLDEGTLSEEALNDAVRRILRIKKAFGLFEKPFADAKDIDYAAHRKEAVRVAEECIVLLKNEENILPLRPDRKLAAVGPMVNAKRDLLGSWTLDHDLELVKSIREAFATEYPSLSVAFAETEMADRAPIVARGKDATLVFLGESALVTGEAHSLASIEITGAQTELIRTLKSMGQKVIAVLCFGRPRALEAIEPYCDAILYASHGGTGAADAIVHTLMGDNIPSGSLPMTLPRCTGQIPLYYNAFRGGSNAYYDSAVGKYEDMALTPLYPFGYGLSYTTFRYGEPKVEHLPTYEAILQGETAILSVEVTNTGTLDAKETVQCYVYDAAASIARPLRELKGFQKVLIPVGKTVKVIFELGKDAFGYYGADSRFRVDKGTFGVFVGRDVSTKNKIMIKL